MYGKVGWGGNAALRNSDRGIHQYIRVATSTFVPGLINILCESQIWRQAVDKCWSNMAWYKSGWNISGNVLKCQEAQPPTPGAPNTCTHTQEPHLVHDAYMMNSRKKRFSLHPDASVTHHLEMIHYATMCWLRHLVDLFGTNYSLLRRFLQKKWSASQPQIYQEMIDSHYQSHLRLRCRLQRCYNPFRYWWFSNISYYRDSKNDHWCICIGIMKNMRSFHFSPSSYTQ